MAAAGGVALRLLIAGLFLLPLLWVASASLRAPGLPPPRGVEWIPDPVSLDAWSRLLTLAPVGRALVLSVVVAAIVVPVTIVVSSLAGFAIGRLGAPARRTLLALAVVLLLVPVPALWLTRFLLYRTVGVIDTPLVLLLPAAFGLSPVFVLLYAWGFRRVPTELIEQARMDGAGPFRAWWSVALPLVLPTTVAVGVLAFVATWGDAVTPLLYLRSDELATLPLAIRTLQTLDRSDWPILMAGALLLALPAIALFGIAQRRFLADDRIAETFGRRG